MRWTAKDHARLEPYNFLILNYVLQVSIVVGCMNELEVFQVVSNHPSKYVLYSLKLHAMPALMIYYRAVVDKQCLVRVVLKHVIQAPGAIKTT